MMVSEIQSRYFPIAGTCSALVALALTAGCTKSETSALKTAPASAQPVIAQQPLATGAPKVARINKRGGTRIAVLVNDTPVTSNEISRRAAFVKLRRIKGNSRKIATDELIEEAIKMKEARRINAVATKAEVDAAYARFAKGNKMPLPVLTKILNQRGVTQQGFKQYIRASISWQRAVAGRIRAEANGTAGGTKSRVTPSWLPAVGTDSSKEKEYTLQQVVFIVPAKQRSSLLSRRRVEAKRFRAQMNGCANAQELAKGLRDVSVIDRGRTLESRLPANWIKEIKGTAAGKVTRTKDTTRGVEILAVCKTRSVIGDQTTAQAELFSGKGFQKAASTMDKKYYSELKERAVIQRR